MFGENAGESQAKNATTSWARGPLLSWQKELAKKAAKNNCRCCA
jgi:hypothetical protein